MAAWLAYLKSRLLLPELEPEQQEEVIDMSDALRFQLLRLEAMQSAAKRLADMPLLGVSRLTRAKAITIEKTEQIEWEASLYDLLSAYGDALVSRGQYIDSCCHPSIFSSGCG